MHSLDELSSQHRRPRHPEQAAWVRQILAEHGNEAEEVWYSHWAFGSPAAAERFEQLLRSVGAEPAAVS